MGQAQDNTHLFSMNAALHTLRSSTKPQSGEEYTSALVNVFPIMETNGSFQQYTVKVFSSSLFPINCHFQLFNEFSTHLIVPTSFSTSVNKLTVI